MITSVILSIMFIGGILVNSDELRLWEEGVFEYSNNLKNVVDDRAKLKELLEEHLSQFFKWDKIVFDREFNRIKLYYKRDTGAVIKSENMSNLGMDWIVQPDYDDEAFKIIRIDVYPFGLPEEGELIED